MTDVTRASGYAAQWKCSLAGFGHQWTQVVATRTCYGAGYPACAAVKPSRATAEYNLEEWCKNDEYGPLLIAKWNDSRSMKDGAKGSGYVAQWKCSRPECGHKWAQMGHAAHGPQDRLPGMQAGQKAQAREVMMRRT
tara:strand:- start:18552 stop:18962 length:411 start_codon:yes stop_codon:yes gene_type:complete